MTVQQEAPTHDRQQEKEAPGHASGRPEKAASEAREAEALAPAASRAPGAVDQKPELIWL